MSETLSSANMSLKYLSMYPAKGGERVTSFVVGVHGDTIDALKEKAAKEYPDAIAIEQSAAEWNAAVQNGFIYDAEKKVLKEKSAPTEEELRQAALDALDAEYATKIDDVETDMAKANATGDAEYLADLKAERESLVAEYTQKRGEI